MDDDYNGSDSELDEEEDEDSGTPTPAPPTTAHTHMVRADDRSPLHCTALRPTPRHATLGLGSPVWCLLSSLCCGGLAVWQARSRGAGGGGEGQEGAEPGGLVDRAGD